MNLRMVSRVFYPVVRMCFEGSVWSFLKFRRKHFLRKKEILNSSGTPRKGKQCKDKPNAIDDIQTD